MIHTVGNAVDVCSNGEYFHAIFMLIGWLSAIECRKKNNDDLPDRVSARHREFSYSFVALRPDWLAGARENVKLRITLGVGSIWIKKSWQWHLREDTGNSLRR
ncbi:hypothetical protein AVO43_10665 [Microbulbifer sp. ZGT114]|nr:hypothetical protein AVO43_10665 [Microbulbifer sp. ZGT114]